MSTWLRRGLVIVLVVTFSKATALLPAGEASPSVNAGGTELWVARYDGPESKIDYANAVVETPDAILPVGVAAASPFSPRDQLWARLYAGAVFRDWVQADAVTSSPDGSKVFVTGGSDQNLSQTDDYATVAYDANDGSKLWVRRYDSGDYDWPWAIAASPDSTKVFVTGWVGGYSTTGDYGTVAYD